MSVTSATTPNATTIVLNLDKPYNPGFFLNNQVQDTNNVYPLPSQSWNVAAAGGPHINDWATNPADAAKIYTSCRSRAARSRHSPPTRCGRSSPVRSS